MAAEPSILFSLIVRYSTDEPVDFIKCGYSVEERTCLDLLSIKDSVRRMTAWWARGGYTGIVYSFTCSPKALLVYCAIKRPRCDFWKVSYRFLRLAYFSLGIACGVTDRAGRLFSSKLSASLRCCL